MTLTRALASLALTMALPQTVLASDWQYCLAPSHAEHKVYMSAPFPAGEELTNADHLFERRLERAGLRHDDVQCPRANNEKAALVMRQHAIAFNHKLGNTIIPLRIETEW